MAKKNNAKNAAVQLARIARYEEQKKKRAKRRSLITIISCSVAAFAIILTVAVVSTNLATPPSNEATPEENSTDVTADPLAAERLDTYKATPPAPEYTPQRVDAGSYEGALPTIDYEAPLPTISYPEGYTVPQDLVVQKLADGQGEAINTTVDSVEMNYSGWNLNGLLFDSNIDPVKKHVTPFPLSAGPSGVIDGWIQGLKGEFKIGDKLMLVIPNSMAYGAQKPDLDSATSAEAQGPLVFYVEFVNKAGASGASSASEGDATYWDGNGTQPEDTSTPNDDILN
jgi:hypothetical protein